jgi:dolichol-phosphate mannosyltransferase
MISIIVPTYNERENIRKLTSGIAKACKAYDYEIIIIDDNSPDGTGSVAEELAKKMPKLRVLHRKKKFGLSSAVIEGFKTAKGSVIGVMDADLSQPPENIPSLLKPILSGKAELSIGSRYIKGGSVEVWPLHRRLISLFATILAKPMTKVKDPMSGFFFMKKEILKGIHFKSEGYKIGLEIIVKGSYKHVAEVPYTFKNRFYGKSKISLMEEYYYLKNLAMLYSYWLTHPKKRMYIQERH